MGFDCIPYRQRVQSKLFCDGGELLLVGFVEVDLIHSAPLAVGLVGFFQGGAFHGTLAVDVDGIVYDH